MFFVKFSSKQQARHAEKVYLSLLTCSIQSVVRTCIRLLKLVALRAASGTYV